MALAANFLSNKCSALLFLFAVTSVSSTYADTMGQEHVSMIKLISDTDSYLHKLVSVKGYYSGGKLFLTREHREMSDWTSAISLVDLSSEGEMSNSCNNKYVRVEATVEKIEVTYVLTNSIRIYDIKARKFCWRGESSGSQGK
ncbi:hypothetical protein GCM10027297_10510 [Parahaliea aestuarii]